MFFSIIAAVFLYEYISGIMQSGLFSLLMPSIFFCKSFEFPFSKNITGNFEYTSLNTGISDIITFVCKNNASNGGIPKPSYLDGCIKA